MRTKDKSSKGETDQTLEGNITYINMPISSEEEDKIGITHYADELKTVIKKGAQSIAVTSDFGGGKSSLIRCLESSYSGLSTKFCYVNLWGQIKQSDNLSETQDIHKAFIYQLASQISLRRGNYVSKRLSKNYGIFTVALPTMGATILSFLIFTLLVVGFVCTTWYDVISKYIDIFFYNDHHNKIGVVAFVFALFFALVFIYKSNIVFSSKKATEDRDVDEHELMDIYKSYICKFHFKHYIVVIEDLDRSDSEKVTKFIKELRRYYIPCRKKRSKRKWINWIYDVALLNVNRITFIVNIKSENEIISDEKEKLYAKAFDYVLNLKEINIDNFDVILKKLLEEKREEFEQNHIPVFTSDNEIRPEFEWIIRGEKLDIREIKIWLNAAISTYVNLCSKSNGQRISLEKCIAFAYITNAYKNEYKEIKNIGFDVILDSYFRNHFLDEDTIISIYENNGVGKDKISLAFARDIRTMICNQMIDSNYKQYFFNFPSDSYWYSDKEERLINIILYDQDVSKEDTFDRLVADVSQLSVKTIINTIKRLDRLEAFYPDCVFYSKMLFDMAILHNEKMIWYTIETKLNYDTESISATSRLLIPVIKNSLIHNQDYIDKLCDIVSRKAKAHALISFRRSLIEHFNQEIMCFKALFMDDCPLITKAEVDSLKNNINMLELVNLSAKELDMDLVDNIHTHILESMDLSNEEIIGCVVTYYGNVYKVFGEIENDKLTQYMFDVMRASGQIDGNLENIIVYMNPEEDILERYVELICLIAENRNLSEQTLKHVANMKIDSHLSPAVCEQLKAGGYYESYVINACNTDITMIDFSEPEVIRAINDLDYEQETDGVDLKALLTLVRERILTISVELVISHYSSLFMELYDLIRESELLLIEDTVSALKLIDVTQIDEDNGVYIANYLSRRSCSLNDSYEILCFVGGVFDENVKKELFIRLDFDMIQYHRLAVARKAHIINLMSDAFDFGDLADQIEFMTITKCSHAPFEKEIWEAIKENEFEDYKEAYAEFVRRAKKINNDMIRNFCALKPYVSMPEHVQEKLYLAKRYKQYVSCKNLENKFFVFETNKLDVLAQTYKDIFLSKEGDFMVSKGYMADNFDFVTYMCAEKLYEGTLEHNRVLFANCRQTKECLQNLFENYDDEFCIEYLSKIKGFADAEAASYFIEKMKENSAVVASDTVYSNNYDPLVDSDLKSKLTRYHNRAKKVS